MSVEWDVQTITDQLDLRSPIISGVLAVLAAVIGMLLTAPYVGLTLPIGIAGVLFIAAGVFVSHSRSYVSLGLASMFIVLVSVGAVGAVPTPVLLIGGVFTVVAWDVGQHAVTLGKQMGRGPPTARGEVIHAVGTFMVGMIIAAILYGVSLVPLGEQAVFPIVLLLLGVVALFWAVRS